MVLNKMMKRVQKSYITWAHKSNDLPFLLLLLTFELLLCGAIIRFVSYTEIDWEAYMQEVDTWQAGELNYRNIRGGTGPLVYPAGFLYLYAVLKHFTNDGINIYTAQVIFAGLYTVTTFVVLGIYTQVARYLVNQQQHDATTSKLQQAHTIWSWRIAMTCCCLSKRIHSIFVLRLFNDGPAMSLLYIAVWLFMNNKWRFGCAFFSLAVSIKMNILLFAPGLLLLLLQFPLDITETIVCLSICAGIQLLLGAPFLLTYPESYLRKAFEFDRVFFYKWTVNWKFLPEDVFVSKSLSVLLLALHLLTLVVLAIQWLRTAKRQTRRYIFLNTNLSPTYVAYTLAVSNMIGIVFSRTLHYQFYVWYFQSLPLLLWMNGVFPLLVRMVLLGMVEYAFNVYPATPTSSEILQVAHLFILVCVAARGISNLTIICESNDNGNASGHTNGKKTKEKIS